MQKQRFASEQTGRKHIGNCLGLYATLVLFTSQMVTREARRGLRKFLSSSMKDIHHPILFARYVIAPVNHILHSHITVLKTKNHIAIEAGVGLKLYWLTRQILIQRMLSVLDTYGWEPECVYKINDEKHCMEWVVSKQSNWGCKHTTGIRGVTQLFFQAYAIRMKQSNNLFEDLTGRTKLLNGKGTFNNPDASKTFIDNDFGLGKEGNLSKSMHSVIIGDDSIDHKYAFDAWTASRKKSPKPRRKAAPSKKKDSNKEDTKEEGDKTEVPTAEVPNEQDDSRRRSTRVSTHTSGYAEVTNVEEEETQANDDPKQKRQKSCLHCVRLAAGVKELQGRSDELTAERIIHEMEDLLREDLPGMDDVLLLAIDTGNTDELEEDDNDKQTEEVEANSGQEDLEVESD